MEQINLLLQVNPLRCVQCKCERVDVAGKSRWGIAAFQQQVGTGDSQGLVGGQGAGIVAAL